MAHPSARELRQGTVLYFRALCKKLFAAKDIDILFFDLPHDWRPNRQNVVVRRLDNVVDIHRRLEEIDVCTTQDTVIVLLQDYTWGRLQITEGVFQTLVDTLNISPRFLKIITAFGVKDYDDERRIYDVRVCSGSCICSQQQHEICYNVVYVEKHGRSLKDPWSFRQLGVYHQASHTFHTSKFILLDLVSHAVSDLKDFVESEPRMSTFAFHIELLCRMGANWAEYIEYLDVELKNFNDKACYSYIQDKSFDVAYPDLQELHKLEVKIQRAGASVKSCVDIARECEQYFSNHSWPSQLLWDQTETLDLLESYVADMKRHRAALNRLESGLKSTLELISRVLTCRNGELLQESNHASYKVLQMLVDITDQSRKQQETLTTILSQGQADSAMLKALSVVATVCLPASLVATVFSSNLIQSTSQSPKPSETHLVLSQQFWTYIVISVPLMVATLTWTLYLDRKSRRSNSTV